MIEASYSRILQISQPSLTYTYLLTYLYLLILTYLYLLILTYLLAFTYLNVLLGTLTMSMTQFEVVSE